MSFYALNYLNGDTGRIFYEGVNSGISEIGEKIPVATDQVIMAIIFNINQPSEMQLLCGNAV